MAIDLAILENLGFPQILLWLLTFAVLYGVLSQAKMPQNKGARTVIAMVIAFFVMISAPMNMINVMYQMSSSLILLLIALLIFIVFLETAGIKSAIDVPEFDEKGKPTGKTKPKKISIFEKHSMLFLFAFIIIAVLIFISSGGLALLGWQFNFNILNNYTVLLLIVVVMAIAWLVANPE